MNTARICIRTLSELSQADFVTHLGDIFEHSPWIAKLAWKHRPFADIATLHASMLHILDAATEDEKLALVRAHPELAGKEASAGTLTMASSAEQRGAGLDQCSRDELEQLQALNTAYQQRFGFPFVVAVKGMSRHQIMEHIENRLNNDRSTELNTCLDEIGKIARFRLEALFA